MGNSFTTADWDLIRTLADTVAHQLRLKGADADRFVPLSPIPASQLDDFSRRTGYAFPDDFADLVTKFAGGWSFWWSLGLKGPYDFLKPPVLIANFGGNGEVPFIGATVTDTLFDRYQAFQSELAPSVNYTESLRVLPALFPLHSYEGNNGSYAVLRLDVSPARIYYLYGSLGCPLEDEYWIGTGFREFLMRWSNLGFPAIHDHWSWVDSASRQPDDVSAKADAWRRWLADPHTPPSNAD